ncbi:MAG: hypothetical protein HWE12_00090 [Oceanospirillaceae bacterium]|nr:hypothetical protein [Oceanospirillaceae bacterium]
MSNKNSKKEATELVKNARERELTLWEIDDRNELAKSRQILETELRGNKKITVIIVKE